MNSFAIRPFANDDIPQLLSLMRGLAKFEGYIDDFAMNREILADWGLCTSPKFHVFVADDGDTLLAYAAAYEIPFTYDCRPTLVLKELYALPKARGSGAAAGVFSAIKQKAKNIGAGRLNWLVLPNNNRAVKFYKKHGGKRDLAWHNWHINF